MDGAAAIRHRTVEANGIAVHVAESGAEGSPRVVLFLHGFPELWYSWRHQMDHLAARGYRCVAPDLRGYGATAAPPDVASYSAFHVVGDVVALLDALSLGKVFVVGHDWGAIIAWYLCLFRPDRVTALVNTSVAFMRHVFIRAGAAAVKTTDYFNRTYGPTYYICRFQIKRLAEICCRGREMSILSGCDELLKSNGDTTVMIARTRKREFHGSMCMLTCTVAHAWIPLTSVYAPCRPPVDDDAQGNSKSPQRIPALLMSSGSLRLCMSRLDVLGALGPEPDVVGALADDDDRLEPPCVSAGEIRSPRSCGCKTLIRS